MKDRREYSKAYYQKNKEIILKKLYKYVVCDICGKSFQKYNGDHHRNTKLHKFAEKIKNELEQLQIKNII